MMIYVGEFGLHRHFRPAAGFVRAVWSGSRWPRVQVRFADGSIAGGFALVEDAQCNRGPGGHRWAEMARTIRDRPLTVNESRPRRTVRDLYTSGGWYGGGTWLS